MFFILRLDNNFFFFSSLLILCIQTLLVLLKSIFLFDLNKVLAVILLFFFKALKIPLIINTKLLQSNYFQIRIFQKFVIIFSCLNNFILKSGYFLHIVIVESALNSLKIFQFNFSARFSPHSILILRQVMNCFLLVFKRVKPLNAPGLLIFEQL